MGTYMISSSNLPISDIHPSSHWKHTLEVLQRKRALANCNRIKITLPKTNIAPENGCLEMFGILVSFWDGLCSGAISC